MLKELKRIAGNGELDELKSEENDELESEENDELELEENNELELEEVRYHKSLLINCDLSSC